MKESVKVFLQHLSGTVIIVTGIFHLIANNLPDIGEAIHESPLYPVNLMIFLTALLYHGLNGARSVLIELIPGPCAAKAITWILVIIGVATYIYGVQVILSLFWGLSI